MVKTLKSLTSYVYTYLVKEGEGNRKQGKWYSEKITIGTYVVC
jgi:hypothetical protein